MDDKIAFIADLHIGNHRIHGGAVRSGLNQRCRLALDTLRNVVEVINNERISHLVILGDLLDSTKVEPQVLSEIQSVLARVRNLSTVRIIAGNHDVVSMDEGDHALGVLDPFARIFQARQPVSAVEGVGPVDLPVTYAPYAQEPAGDYLREVLLNADSQHGAYGGQGVLCLHAGISDETTPPWLKNSMDSVPADLLAKMCAASRHKWAFAGNWHDYRQWKVDGVTITQVGALCPTGWDNPGLNGYGGMMILDPLTDNLQRVEIVGPRFITATFGEHEVLMQEAFKYTKVGYKIYLRLITTKDETANAVEYLENLIDIGSIYEGEVKVEKKVSTVQKATKAVVAASSIEEAVTEYIRAMELAKEVNREAVMNLVGDYLKCG